ncbi:MAG: flagellar biosynthesis protein FlhF [Chitinispirillales bacterium]|jgi:flagellar biosynthesis protein FlhF|nr:flagellar biosynthesis protein FlhF [Chitinispirillales bacterium]
MRIKKYIAKSMREALLQIKEELGDEAIILKTSKLQKKMFGLAGPDEIEVTAAIDDDAPAKKSPEFEPLHMSSAKNSVDLGLYGRPRAASPEPLAASSAPAPAMPEPAAPTVRPYFPPRQTPYAPPGVDGPERQPLGDIPQRFPASKRTPDEIAELKADVRELKDLVKAIVNSAASGAPKDATSADDSGWDAFVKRLTDSEVKPAIAKKLVNSIRGVAQITDAELEEKLSAALSEQFPVSGPLKLKKDGPLIVAFVGPTGSGKTTTLAKLAAYCCINKSKKISIITADTYRIAAIEQIRAFADIVNVGLQIVFSPDEMPAALAACEGSDVVFVDNAGRSQRDKEHMEELRLLVDVLRPDETHLVLSATTKDSDLLDMVQRYRNIKVNRLLFTKLDETTKLGNIFNIVSDLGIPVSYFTMGQSVPDDIELAQAGKFVKRLMEGRAL